MKKILVYGGCISRDIFNDEYNKGDLQLESYIARYSLAKLCAKPIKVELDEKKVPSAFQRKMIEIDGRNNLLSYIENRLYDYILMDFMFTRFRLVEYKGSLLTYSAELSRAKIIRSHNKVINPGTEIYWEYFLNGLHKFLSFLKKKELIGKLIINKIYLSKKDNEGRYFEDQLDIETQNEFLHKIYEILAEYLDENQFLEYDSELFVADVKHHWGRNPMHFISEFYMESYNKLLRI